MAKAEQELEKLERLMAEPDFWNEPEKSQAVTIKANQLKTKIGGMTGLKNSYDDLMLLIDMGIDEQDGGIINEVKKMKKEFVKAYESLHLATLLSGDYDDHSAIVSLHAGAGGTESCDWVSMLYRMYGRWAEAKGYRVEVLDMLDGDEAGIKSITFSVNGENAYGYLQSEKGVHRLVRISPFDSSGRRHTSFASCDILPELADDDNDIELNDEDIRIDTYRASGAGGQHINKTDSAIRITHLPTGIVVQCQNERSQHKNKDRALKMLKAKLYEIKEREQLEKIQDIRGEMKEIGWGSQIRSYVMHPYSMVKDHRTNQEVGNVNSVMDGNLDNFINSYLQWKTLGGS